MDFFICDLPLPSPLPQWVEEVVPVASCQRAGIIFNYRSQSWHRVMAQSNRIGGIEPVLETLGFRNPSSFPTSSFPTSSFPTIMGASSLPTAC